jgi:hypothetical protein
MTEEQLRQPTRLSAWDVRSLYAHAASWPSILSALTDRVREAEPVVATAAAFLRYLNAPDGIAHTMRDKVASDACDDAARYL